MKRFLTTSLVALALFVSFAGALPVAHAQTDPNTTIPSGQAAAAPGDAAAVAAAAGTPTNNATTADLPSGFGTVMTWIMSLFAWLAGVAMITLNYATFYTVVNMGSYVTNLTAVGVTWRILRDLGNILLIFGFLATGIATILDYNIYGDRKKMLPTLLIVAVFINFSLFASEAVVDVGNLFATQFYTQINNGVLPTPATLGNHGISDTIMAQLGLATIYGDASNPTTAKDVLKPGTPWYVGFMGIILFIVLAFVLFALAFVLIARFVILLFLIIVAPIGFAGLIVPKLDNLAKQWWSMLFRQTITAPILLLMLYIALTIITDAHFLTGFGTSQAAEGAGWLGTVVNGGLAGFGPVLLSFIVAMGSLLLVVILARSMSSFGASAATTWAGKLSFGAVGWAGRTTVGWGSNRAAKYLRGTRLARVPLVGSGLVRGLERGATASFDVRGIKAGGGLKGGLKIDAGTAQKGGYKADLKTRVESRTKYATDLKGRELNDQEKIDAAKLSNQIKDDTKELEKLRTSGATLDMVKEAEENLKKKQQALEKIESVTDKGAKREYARALNLWTDENNVFNKYVNFAANTEAAKKIRDEAKKSKDDKSLDSLKKLLKEAEDGEEKKTPAAPDGAAAAPSSPTTPS